jgi:imidazolonepropionase-like amidohydrolase
LAERATSGFATAAGRARSTGHGVAASISKARTGGATSTARGVVFLGTIWTGGDAEPFDGVVIVDGAGRLRRCGPSELAPIPDDLPTFGGPGCWIGPGIIDAHVHLALADLEESLIGGVVAVRDLGAPMSQALRRRTGHGRPPRGRPFVAVSGPILTAPGGYPSRSWGANGFAEFVPSAASARAAVHRLASDGVDLIKLALEPGAGWAVPDPRTVRAIVDTAHAAGLAVVAHALSVDMVTRAVDAGVDELVHMPTERLPEELVERIVAADITVVSTMQTFFAEGLGRDVGANALALVQAGARLVYGTDLGNTGTRSGVDPRELDRLADAGLGRLGALRTATEGSAGVAGVRNRTGLLRIGAPVELVVLPGDPLLEPGAWRTPTVVLADARLTRRDRGHG